jgi:hypothetical protein
MRATLPLRAAAAPQLPLAAAAESRRSCEFRGDPSDPDLLLIAVKSQSVFHSE